MVVKHDIITSIKNIEITYKSENVYSIYDLDTQVIYNCGYLKVMEEFKKINNIISMKIQAIICDLNIYRYPEIISISVC